jgi:SAM-dependent methyltransferase
MMVDEAAPSADDSDIQQFTFDDFAAQPEYVAINRDFVARTLDGRLHHFVLDVACGTGLVTGMIAERLRGLPARIFGVDPNPASVALARAALTRADEPSVEFVLSDGAGLGRYVPPQSVDAAYFCNAIHEIQGDEPKRSVLEAIAGALRPGGQLFINSAFTAEWMTEDGGKPYAMWKLQAFKLLDHIRDKTAVRFDTLSIDDYSGLLRSAGLQVRSVQKYRVDLTEQAMRAIAGYHGWISGMFQDMEGTEEVSMVAKHQALIDALAGLTADYRRRFGETARMIFPRNWVEFVAQKPA